MSAYLIAEEAAHQHPHLLLGADSREIGQSRVDDLEWEPLSPGDPETVDLLCEVQFAGGLDAEAGHHRIDIGELARVLWLRWRNQRPGREAAAECTRGEGRERGRIDPTAQ